MLLEIAGSEGELRSLLAEERGKHSYKAKIRKMTEDAEKAI